MSLYRQRARFEDEVARNFVVPAVVELYGVFVRAEDMVSIVFAVRYVPK